MSWSRVALLAIEFRSLAPADYRAILALGAIEAGEDKAVPLLAAFAPASPSRLLVTARFIAAIATMRRASCDLLAAVWARTI